MSTRKKNGPKSMKAISKGMGLGMSLLPNQTVQTTAIPQTPAVCTAAVKWKNTISSPVPGDKKAILNDKEENDQEELNVSKKTKKWSDIAKTKVGSKKDKKGSTSSPDPVPQVEPDGDSSRKTPNTDDTNSTARASLVSAEVDKSPAHTQQVTHRQPVKASEDDTENKDDEVTYAENQLITAIPLMPLSLAVLCLFLNIFVPGTGTIIASLSVFCCGKQQPDPSGKKEASVDLMITNLCVGISQLFTVTFLFIGLIWSITWGVFMVQFAWVQYKKDKEERERLAQISVANAFLIPGMRS